MCHCLLVVNHAIDEWRCRLTACVEAEGGHLNITYDCYSQKVTMSKWKHCKFNQRGLFMFSFAVNVNEQRIIVFLTEVLLFKFMK